jgi:hypothetical protein
MAPRVRRTPIGITGSSRLRSEHIPVIHRAFVRLNPAETRLIVGGQVGVDIIAAILGLAMGFEVHCVLPGTAPVDRMADVYCHTYETIFVSGNQTNAKLYLARNARMVELSTRMIAFPLTSKEIVRSGTWQCVRQTQKARKKIDIHPLDGS